MLRARELGELATNSRHNLRRLGGANGPEWSSSPRPEGNRAAVTSSPCPKPAAKAPTAGVMQGYGASLNFAVFAHHRTQGRSKTAESRLASYPPSYSIGFRVTQPTGSRRNDSANTSEWSLTPYGSRHECAKIHLLLRAVPGGDDHEHSVRCVLELDFARSRAKFGLRLRLGVAE